MRIHLIRHSLAVDEGHHLPDSHRYLSVAGRDRAMAVGQVLAKRGVVFDRILTSPLVRAVQTAELVARNVPCGDIVVLDVLAVGGAPEAVVGRLGSASTIALVGHAPGISEVGAVLVSRPSFPPLRPGQVAVIDRGQPIETLNPETLAFEPLLVADG